MFLMIICYNLSLPPLPCDLTATKVKYTEGMHKLEKTFSWQLLASETTPCLLHVAPTFSPSPGLVSLEE